MEKKPNQKNPQKTKKKQPLFVTKQEEEEEEKKNLNKLEKKKNFELNAKIAWKSYHNICDVIKQNESELANTDFKI